MGKINLSKKSQKVVKFITIRYFTRKSSRKNPKKIPEINDENSMEEVNLLPGPSQNNGNESSNSISSTILNNSYFSE